MSDRVQLPESPELQPGEDVNQSNTIYIVPSLAIFTQEFTRRLTPPYDLRDANSDAEISVLNNVRMAYINQDQYPIPSSTSAEGGIARLIHSTGKEVSIIGREIESPFIGSLSMRNFEVEIKGSPLNPFQLLRQNNDYNIGVYALKIEEVSSYLNDELMNILKNDYSNGKAIVVTVTDDIDDFGIGNNY